VSITTGAIVNELESSPRNMVINVKGRPAASLHADLLIRNAHIITVDANDSVVNGGVAVTGESIVAVGDLTGWTANNEIDAHDGIVMPGMINTHAHLAMTMFRGFADDMDLDGFLGRILPAEGAVLSPSSVEIGVRVAVAECLRAGITSALDMYFFPEVAHQVAIESGFRLHAGPVAVMFDGPDARSWSARLKWMERWLNDDDGQHHRALGSSKWLMPHSTYLVTEAQLRDLAALADSCDARVTVHAGETLAEIAQVAELHSGRTPFQVLADVGLLNDRCVLAHAVHMTDADIASVAASGAGVAHNPASNLKLASGIARVTDMRAAAIPVGLGTDGAASANDLDLFMAMRLAAYMAKGTSSDATVLPANEIIRMATMDGARLLGVDHQRGSVEVGKQADLVVLDGNSPSMAPIFHAASTVANAACRAEVTHVIVAGRHVVSNGHVETVDVQRAVDSLRSLAHTIE
jgi:5-methylthioadenosine/S-adenosylhomocysteine deaminase